MACSHVHAPPALTAWTVLEYLMSYSLYCSLMGIQRNKTKVNTQISDNAGLLVYYYYHACTPHAIGVFLSSFYTYLIIFFDCDAILESANGPLVNCSVIDSASLLSVTDFDIYVSHVPSSYSTSRWYHFYVWMEV